MKHLYLTAGLAGWLMMVYAAFFLEETAENIMRALFIFLAGLAISGVSFAHYLILTTGRGSVQKNKKRI